MTISSTQRSLCFLCRVIFIWMITIRIQYSMRELVSKRKRTSEEDNNRTTINAWSKLRIKLEVLNDDWKDRLSLSFCSLQNIGHLIFLFASAYILQPLQNRSNVIMPLRLFSYSSPRKLSPSSSFSSFSSDKLNSMHSVFSLCHF